MFLTLLLRQLQTMLLCLSLSLLEPPHELHSATCTDQYLSLALGLTERLGSFHRPHVGLQHKGGGSHTRRCTSKLTDVLVIFGRGRAHLARQLVLHVKEQMGVVICGAYIKRQACVVSRVRVGNAAIIDELRKVQLKALLNDRLVLDRWSLVER
jgi:hypothetical protein